MADANAHSGTGQWLQSVDNPVGYTQGQGFLIPPSQPVPEPSTLVLAAVALTGGMLVRRRVS